MGYGSNYDGSTYHLDLCDDRRVNLCFLYKLEGDSFLKSGVNDLY